jgi:hypothetical protein
MHRSRLSALMIDCHNATMESGVQFWSQALGLTIRQENAASPYVALTGNSGELQLHLQRIGEPSRLHLDIEADDVEAEVQRLEQLGARRHAQVQTWWIMEAPSGHYFCVVPAQSHDFAAQANVWDTEATPATRSSGRGAG